MGVLLSATLTLGQRLVPSAELLRDAGMLWLAAGIVGATVMPHNRYLHSTLAARHLAQVAHPAHAHCSH